MTVIEQAQAIRDAMDAAGVMLDDAQAVQVKRIYPQWETLIGTPAVQNKTRFLYGDDLYKVTGADHTFAAQWVPGIDTASLYTRIDETHAGTIDDPIPYDGNMELAEGKYYTQGGVRYYCYRSTGIPVYNALADLVNLYVTVA